MIRPISSFSTNTAKANCNPRPHKTVLTRMARRLVEKMNAANSMAATPRIPVRRPIQFILFSGFTDRSFCGHREGPHFFLMSDKSVLGQWKKGHYRLASLVPGQFPELACGR